MRNKITTPDDYEKIWQSLYMLRKVLQSKAKKLVFPTPSEFLHRVYDIDQGVWGNSQIPWFQLWPHRILQRLWRICLYPFLCWSVLQCFCQNQILPIWVESNRVFRNNINKNNNNKRLHVSEKSIEIVNILGVDKVYKFQMKKREMYTKQRIW